MKFSNSSSLGSWGLIPGDGLMVTCSHGAWVKQIYEDSPNDPNTRYTSYIGDARLENGTILFVTNEFPKTAGVVALSSSGIKFVITDIDIKLGAITILTRGGI